MKSTHTAPRPQPQIWNAPPKQEKYNRIWENIKKEIQAHDKNETLRNENREPPPQKMQFV